MASEIVKLTLEVAAGAAEAELRSLASAADKTADSTKKVTNEVKELTAEEKALVAEVVRSEAAFKAKARALGLTETQLRRVESASKGSAKGAGEMAGAAKNLAQKFEGLEDGAGKADSILQALGSTLDLVNPQLGAAFRAAGDLAGGLEAIIRIGTKLLGPLAVIAALALALYMAYKDWAESIKAADEAQQNLNKTLRDQSDMRNKLASLDLAAQEKLLTEQLKAGVALGEEERGVLEGRLAAIQGAQAVEERRNLLQEEALKNQRRLVEIEREKKDQASDTVETQNALEAEKAAIMQRQSEIGAKNRDLDREANEFAAAYLEQTEGAAQFAERQAESEKERLRVNKEIAVAINSQAKAAADLKAALTGGLSTRRDINRSGLSSGARSLAEQEVGISFGAAEEALLGASSAADAQTAAEALSALYKSAQANQAAMDDAQDTLGDWKTQIEAATAALPGAIEGVMGLEEAFKEVRREVLKAAGKDAAMSLASGNLSGAITAFAPGVGTALQALDTIGGVGAEGIGDTLEEQAERLLKGITELPKLAGQVLPEFIVKFSFALAKTLVVELPKAFFQAWKEIFESLQAWLERLLTRTDEEKAEAKERRQTRRENRRDWIVDVLGSAFSGARASGGTIDKTGLYLMHQGEYVTPAHGAAPGGVGAMARAMAGGGGGVVINAGIVTPSLEREIAEITRRSQSGYGLNQTLTPAV